MSTHIYGFDDVEHQWEPVHITSGKLKVDATLDTTGLATSALQDTTNTKLESLDTKITACNTGAISGTVGVTGDVSVTGTFYPTSQTVNGTVAVSSVGGDVSVTGEFYPTSQTVNGSVAVSSVTGDVSVTGDFYQTTQPISATALPLPQGASTNAEQLLIKQAITDANDNNYDTENVVVGVTSSADSSSYNMTNYSKVELIAVGTVSANMLQLQVQWSDDNSTWYHPSFYQTLSTSYSADGVSNPQEILTMSCPARAKYVRAQMYNTSTTLSDTVKLIWSRVH